MAENTHVTVVSDANFDSFFRSLPTRTNTEFKQRASYTRQVATTVWNLVSVVVCNAEITEGRDYGIDNSDCISVGSKKTVGAREP